MDSKDVIVTSILFFDVASTSHDVKLTSLVLPAGAATGSRDNVTVEFRNEILFYISISMSVISRRW